MTHIHIVFTITANPLQINFSLELHTQKAFNPNPCIPVMPVASDQICYVRMA